MTDFTAEIKIVGRVVEFNGVKEWILGVEAKRGKYTYFSSCECSLRSLKGENKLIIRSNILKDLLYQALYEELKKARVLRDELKE